MPVPQSVLLCLGLVLMVGGVVMALCVPHHSLVLFGFGLCAALLGIVLIVTGLCMAIKNLQVAVPGHFLLHPRTGTRFSPHQALAIQRRLDRIRREMSEDSVARRPATPPEPSLPSTPPPWDMEPPPSYDTVMKADEQAAPPRLGHTSPDRHVSQCLSESDIGSSVGDYKGGGV